MKKKNIRSPKRNFRKFIFIPILIIIFVSIFLIKRIFKINKIECVSQLGACPTDIENGLKATNNIKKYLNENTIVNSYQMQFQLPDTLKIFVNIKKPKFAVYDRKTSKFYLADSSGTILSSSDTTTLPAISEDSISAQRGGKLNDKELFALNLLEKVNWIYSIKSGNLDIDNETISIKINDNITALFPDNGDVDYLVGSLRLIFSRLNGGEEGIKMNNISEIDLRFKNPVLR